MKHLYTIILCLFFFSGQAQNYYYNGSEKIEIYQSTKSFISYDNPTEKFTQGFNNVKTFEVKGFSIVEEEKNDIVARKFRKENLTQTTPALLLDTNSDFKLFPTKTIRIKLKAGHTKVHISRLLKRNDFTEIEEKYGIFRVTVNDIHKVLEIANKIYESDIAEFSIPDFYIPMELNQVIDPLFPLQFQMHNTGQVIDGVAGVNDIDVNALEAWDISLGDNVTVAVFDQGMEYHEDFGNRLIGGNTPITNGDGTPLQNNATHGMNCAGVIGASDDNLGLRGVAPNVNFLSVNIFAGGETPGDIADGIRWAIDNGADVLSNSWSYPLAPCSWTHIDIENALQDAVNNGRNKDGAVIVFSSGNMGGCVEYPARNNNVISVGAVDNRGNLFSYSSRGPELDLVAPSGETNYVGNVRTTDRMGDTGRLPGHYEPRFGGTSASCPVVSGVAALVLSVNPNLTQQEVRDILTSTATDMGVGGFDNNFGYGRVNAFAAISEVLSSLEIVGGNTVCNSNSYYSLSDVPAGIPVSWTVSSNLHKVSETSAGVTVRAINSSIQGTGFVRANVGSSVKTKEVWVGKAKVSKTTFGSCYEPFYRITARTPDTALEFKVTHNGSTQYHTSSLIVLDPYDYNLQDGQSTVVYVSIRNACGWSQSYPVNIYKPTLCDCGYDNPSCGGSDGPPSPLNTSSAIVVYPNPANNIITVDMADMSSEDNNFHIMFFDLDGNLINSINTTETSVQVDVSSYENGSYKLSVSNDLVIESRLFIVQH